MKIITTSLLALIAIAATGCKEVDTPAPPVNPTQQLLDAQEASVQAVQGELEKLRSSQPTNIKEWSPEAITMYTKWQAQIGQLTKERQELIYHLQRGVTVQSDPNVITQGAPAQGAQDNVAPTKNGSTPLAGPGAVTLPNSVPKQDAQKLGDNKLPQPNNTGNN